MRENLCAFPDCNSPRHGRGVCRSHYMKCWRGQMEWPDYEPRKLPSREERFWAKVEVANHDECREWAASRLPNGYGQFGSTTAHRAAVEISTRQPVNADMVVDHLCRNRGCVNPAHLEVVTQSVNVIRGLVPLTAGKRVQEWSISRTHCAHGHLLDEANTYRSPSHPTWRVCRTCRKERAKARRERNIGSAD